MTRANGLVALVLAAALLAAPFASAGKPDEQGNGNGNSGGGNGNSGGNGDGNAGGNNGHAGGNGNGNGNSGGSNGNAGGSGASNGEPQGQGSASQADPPAGGGSGGEPGQGQGNGHGASAHEPGASGGNGNGASGGGSEPAPDTADQGPGGPGSSGDPPASAEPASGGNGASSGNGNGHSGGDAQGRGQSGGGQAQGGGSHSNGQGQGSGVSPASPGAAGQTGGGADGGQGGQAGSSGGAAPSSDPRPAAGSPGPARGEGATPPADPPIVSDASPALAVQRGAAGNLLSWSVPVDAGQVQVWRRDSSGWVPVAVVDGADGQATDPEGGATSEYRLTWSSQALGSGGLAIAAKTLPVTTSSARGALGQALALLMWAGIAGVGLVRANVPRRLLESRPGAEHALLPLLAGLPGVDVAALERVNGLGLRTVAQLRAVDADTLAFWARLPAPVVRQWKETLELLVWPALPAGAGERLALAGQTSLAHLASARGEDLLARLRAQSGVDGPGLPADEAELAAWIAEARIALGLAPTATRAPAAEGTVDALRSSTPGVA